MTIGRRKDGKTELLFYGWRKPAGTGARLPQRVVLTARQWQELCQKMKDNGI